ILFSSSTPAVCTVDGAFVNLITTGTCSVQAAQPGNGNFAAAPPVTFSFGVYPSVVSSAPPAPSAPLLEYMAAVRGSGYDRVFDVAVAADGNAYLAGSVATTEFPGLSSATITNAGLD